MTDLYPQLIAESALTPDQRTRLVTLLVAAFPQMATMFEMTAWASADPDYRLWLETPDGRPIAHLGFGLRTIGVSNTEVLVAGVGGVATHPDWQGKGIGRRLLAELQRTLRHVVPVPFGYLGCRPAVVPF